MDGRAKREGEGVLHYCIRCGGEFTASDPDVVLCPRCRAEEAGAQSQDVPTMPAPAAGTPQKREVERGTPPAPPASEAPVEAPRPIWQEGETIDGRYRVLGSTAGGMGVVYFVEHLGWRRKLAVKSIRPDYLDDERALQNFLQEAWVWVELGLHPHIATCYYVRTVEGLPRIFIEYVEGGDLRHYLDAHRGLSLREKLDLLTQCARGMEYAHRHGLVHRDLKPQNCLVTPAGELKVTDFGTALAPGAGVVDEGRGEVVRLEGTFVSAGGVAGTPEYMAPEQFEGAAVTASDVYAFGVTAYEVLSGRRPFQMPEEMHPMARMYFYREAHQGEPVPVLEGGFPGALVGLVMGCLEKEAGRRPGTFGEVEQQLLKVYEAVAGVPYPRPVVDELELRADSLNNKAVSLLDLGREEEAIRCWSEALQTDSSHPEANLSLACSEWHQAKITDAEMLTGLSGIQGANLDSEPYWYGLACLHAERGDVASAHECYEHAKRLETQRTFPTGGSNIALDRTLEGHEKQVFALIFLESTEVLASGASDETIRLWDLESGRCSLVLRGAGFVTSVSFSPDGRYLASSSADHSVKVWDLRKGRLRHRLQGHSDVVTSVSFSCDGTSLLSSSMDGTIKLWDLTKRKGKCIRTYEGHEHWVLSVEFVPGGKTFLSGSRDQTVRLWDLRTGKVLRTFGRRRSPRKAEYGQATSKAGQVLWVGYDGMFLWDFATGQLLRTFRSSSDAASITPFVNGDLSPDGQSIVTVAQDGQVRFWDATSGRCIRTVELNGAIWCARFITANQVALGVSNKIQIWQTDIHPASFVYQPLLSIPQTGAVAAERQAFLQSKLAEVDALLAAQRPATAQALIREVQATPGLGHERKLLERLSACGMQGRRRRLREWWRSHDFHLGEYEGLGGVQSLRFSPDGDVLAVGHQEGTVGIFDVERGQCRTVLARQRGHVTSLVFLDQQTLLSMSHFGDLIRWNLATGIGQRLDTEVGVREVMHLSTALSEDGAYFALIGLDGYTLKPTRPVSLSPVHAEPYRPGLTRAEPDLRIPAVMGRERTGWLFRSAVSPDSSLYTTTLLEETRGGGMHTIYLWEPGARGIRVSNRLVGHTDPVRTMAFAPTANWLAAGDLGGNVKIWDIARERCIRTLTMPDSQITALAYSPDGNYLLAGDKGGSLFLWDTTGNLLASNPAHGKMINVLAFSPEGRFAASGGADNAIHLWEFDFDYEFPEPADWDEGARPYLKIFLTLHTPHGPDGISRVGAPTWTKDDFQRLLTELGYRGYGWLRPEGVRRKLEELTRSRR